MLFPFYNLNFDKITQNQQQKKYLQKPGGIYYLEKLIIFSFS